MNAEKARDKFPLSHNSIRLNKRCKSVSCKAQVPPLLRQRHNAALG